jgi:RNA polymerase sigma factor (TIGR02999 family)
VTESGEITALLTAMREGDRAALDRLFPLVYAELRQRAHRQLAHRKPGETLSTTALVHEAYLKLAGSEKQSYNDRVHFFAVASRAMRHILVDHARQASAAKRDGGVAVNAEVDRIADPARADELVALDDALQQLEGLDERLARTVELRFFGGLSVDEVAVALGVSARTVKRDWRKARAWLYRELRDDVSLPDDAEPGV